MTKCPKVYKLPTIKWLKPIKRLIEDNNDNPKNKIYSSELIENEITKEKVIVKLSKVTSLLKSPIKIYETIKESPHIATIYCFLNCNEKTQIIDEDYKDTLGFCNADSKDNQLISLEIMKKYNYSLRKYQKKCDLEETESFIRYILLFQLELFKKYNFIHGDIHLGNILVSKQKTETPVLFNFDDIKLTIITKKLLVLTDFEESIILSSKTKNNLLYEDDVIYTKTLESSILNTLYCAVELLNYEKDSYRISRILNKHNTRADDTRELVKKYCSNKITTNEYTKEVIKLLYKIIIPTFYKMFNSNFII